MWEKVSERREVGEVKWGSTTTTVKDSLGSFIAVSRRSVHSASRARAATVATLRIKGVRTAGWHSEEATTEKRNVQSGMNV